MKREQGGRRDVSSIFLQHTRAFPILTHTRTPHTHAYRLRYSGLVILLQLSYTNYYLWSYFGGTSLLGTGSWNGSRVDYFYQ